MTQFHVYVGGKPTKGIFNTLQEAHEAYSEEASAGMEVEIKTVNSPGPVTKWYFDQKVKQWVQSA